MLGITEFRSKCTVAAIGTIIFMIRAEQTRQRAFLSVGLLLFAGLVAYSNSLDGAFVFDDEIAIVKNESLRSLWPLHAVLRPPRDGSPVEARPLVNLSLAINYAWGGLQTRGYHVANLAIHLLAGIALFGCVRRTLLLPRVPVGFRQASLGLSLTCALLWIVHPLQTESVAYTSQRAESLVGLFYLTTMYCSIRAASLGRWWGAAAVAACALGMASKEVMVSAPLMVVLYDRAFLFDSFASAFRQRRWLYLALAATWLLLLMLVLPSATRSGSAGWGQGIGVWHYLLTQAHAIVRYLQLCVWPDKLVLDYDTTLVRNPIEVAPQAALILLLISATIWCWPRRPWAGFLGTWFFATLAPTSSFVPIVTQTMAEHRMYLPLAPVVILLVVGAYAAWQRAQAGRGNQRVPLPLVLAVALAAILLAGRTVVRNRDYRTQFSAWEANLRDWPSSQRPRLALADRLMAQGEAPAAIRLYTEALQWQPHKADIYNARGVARSQIGDFEGAIADHTKAIELQPDWLAFNNRGLAHRGLGRFQLAVNDHSQAIQLNPQYALAYYARAIALRELRQPQKALADLNSAIQLKSDLPEAYHDRGALHQVAGDNSAALRDYTQAIRFAPNAALPRVNRGRLHQQLGRLEQAEADFTQALARNPQEGEAYLLRAACYLDLGRLELARRDLMAAQSLGFHPSAELGDKFKRATQPSNINPAR